MIAFPPLYEFYLGSLQEDHRAHSYLMTLPDANVPEATAAKQAASGGIRVGVSLEKAHRR